MRDFQEIADEEMLENIKEDKNYHVLQVLTKEQFEEMSYKIKEQYMITTKETDKNNAEIKIADLKKIYLKDNKTKLFLTEDDKKKFTSDYIDNHNVKR